MQSNAVGWFEVPVTNMDRAIKFYETVLDIKLDRNQMEPLDMAWFPMTDESYGSAGSLVCHTEYYTPSTNGVVIYFIAHSGDLSNELSRVEEAGDKVLQPKTKISDEYGYMALLIDTEGNRVALHSRE
ncbi:VOC family protein [Draconibacterium sp.]|uniref:VOC family protein n=1 Tax=Draconibacterium sp. TaxID=1965318 RepID=UPI0035682D30